MPSPRRRAAAPSTLRSRRHRAKLVVLPDVRPQPLPAIADVVAAVAKPPQVTEAEAELRRLREKHSAQFVARGENSTERNRAVGSAKRPFERKAIAIDRQLRDLDAEIAASLRALDVVAGQYRDDIRQALLDLRHQHFVRFEQELAAVIGRRDTLGEIEGALRRTKAGESKSYSRDVADLIGRVRRELYPGGLDG